MPLTFGSLFSGIGGLDLGLERAGMQCKWQVEINEFCQKVLTKHWPDVPKYRDTRECGDNLEPVDIICGGFPCQPFSVAGKRRGKDDDRYLWPEMLRIIKAVRPTWVVGENVPGIIKLALDNVFSDMESCGYTCQTIVFPACAVGAPHIRQRVWVIAYSASNGLYSQDSRSIRENQQPQKARNEIFVQTGGHPSHMENTDGGGQPEPNICPQQSRGTKTERTGENVADAFSGNERGTNLGRSPWSWWWEREPLEMLQDARRRGRQEDVFTIPESLLGRVVNGVPSRVDRLKSLGNAVVPQVAELIGRMIVQFHESSM